MKRILPFLCATFLLPSLCLAEPEPTPADADETQVGRYSMSFSVDGLYFLDTATGELWLKRGGGRWRRVDSPVVRVKERPVQDGDIMLDLPKRGLLMPMNQRERRKIPGSDGTLVLKAGDVTAGQVFVEVVDDDDNTVLDRTSLALKEYARFRVGKEEIFIQLVELDNVLMGNDICEFRLSTREPKLEKAAVEGGAREK